MKYDADGFEPPPGAYILSTTANNAWKKCQRYWSFQHVHDVDDGRDKSHFHFGSVLHLCAERWLLAGPTGIVPAPVDVPEQPFDNGKYATGSALYGQIPGMKVNVFPYEFWRYQERDGSWVEIPKAMAPSVEQLIRKGIEERVLRHLPDGKVERKFWTDLGNNNWVTSLLDYSSVQFATVEDHKTAKNLKWAMDPDELAKDDQKLVYAGKMCEWTDSDEIHIAHNYFEKQGERRVRKVETVIHRDDALEYTEKLKAEVREQRILKEGKVAPTELPPTKTSCDAYGGCPYRSRCFPDRIKPLITTPRTLDVNVAPNPGAIPPPAAATVPPASVPPAAVPPAASAPPPQSASEPPQEAAVPEGKWANPNCTICSGEGRQVDGAPCPLCLQRAGATGALQTAPPAQSPPVAEATFTPPPPPPPAPAAAPPAAAPPAAAPAPAAAVPQVEAPQPQVEASIGEGVPNHPWLPDREGFLAEARSKGLRKTPGRGRAKAGFRMFVDCSPTIQVGGRETYPLRQLVIPIIERAMQDPSYAEANVFQQRSQLATLALDIAVAAGKHSIVCSNGDYDLKPLIEALKGYAEEVFEGIR